MSRRRTTSPSCARSCSTPPTPRALADFYRELLGYPATGPGHDECRRAQAGDEARGRDWLVLLGCTRRGASHLAFQQVDELHRPPGRPRAHPSSCTSTSLCPTRRPWRPSTAVPSGLGARLLLDGSDDPEEPIYVYADPDGHPFCIFVRRA